MPTPRTRATAILLRGDAVLMIERFRGGERYFVLPGGGVEPGESAEAATLRELAEETSIKAELVREAATFVSPDGDTHRLFVCRCDAAAEPRLADDSVEAAAQSADNSFRPLWVPLADLGGLTVYPLGTREAIVGAVADR
jgi:8-oxo-dGTP diphosphatase